MKRKSLVLFLLVCVVLSIPATALAERPGHIVYNMTKFHFGQVVYFNLGDCMEEEFDSNKYLFPHVYKDKEHIKKGIFIGIKDYGFPPGGKGAHYIATVAYVDRHGDAQVITRHAIQLLPRQRTIILNW
jgi:hypothetical protein